MRIYLKPDWDYPSSYDPDSSKGYFVGRRKEKDQLVDEFIRKNSGSILVSGARGVGKTSLVYAALQEVVSKNDKAIPVVINASQLELYIDHEEKKLPEVIIRNLIRRLYGNFQKKQITSPALYEKIGNLYKKAIAKEFDITNRFSAQSTEGEMTENSEEKTAQISYDNEKIAKIIFMSLGAITFFLPDIVNSSINKIIGIALFLMPNLAITKIIKKTKNAIDKKEEIRSAEQLYKEDNSLSNLEYEFNEILKNLADDGVKVIFVIDELDKLDGEKEGATLIFQIIKTYKNLFTLSSALFIFITSNQAYEEVLKEGGEKGQKYTLFNNRMFLTRPDFTDLESFFEKIIFKIETQDGKEIIKDNYRESLADTELTVFRNFINFLCYKSRSDYFELYLVIRDYITSYEELDGYNYPVIDIEELTFDQRLQSKLQKMLGQVFALNIVKEQSQWYKNNTILLDLYEFLETNYYQDITLPTSTPDIIKRFMIPYLCRVEIIKPFEYQDGEFTLTGYQWTANIPGERGSEDIKSTPGILFRSEEIFLKLGKKYIQQINDIDDLDKIILGEGEPWQYEVEDGISDARDGSEYTGINASAVYEKYKYRLNGLDQAYPVNVNTEELKIFNKELLSEIKKILENIPKIFSGVFKKVLTANIVSHAENNLQNDAQLFEPFTELRSDLISKNITHSVIYKDNPEKSKQVLVIQNIQPEFLSNSTLELLSKNDRFRIVNLQTDDHLDYSEKEEITEFKFKFIKVPFRGKERRKRTTVQEKRPVDGFLNIPIQDNYQDLINPLKATLKWFSE